MRIYFVLRDVTGIKNLFLRLRKIIAIHEKQTETVAEKYMLQMRVNSINAISIFESLILLILFVRRMKIAITKIYSGLR